MLAAGVASHVQRKVKGMIPVNNEQAGGCCRPNNMQVKSTTLLRPQPPPSFTCCFSFLHFFLRDELFFLTLLPCFSHAALSLSISPSLIYFLGCVFSDVTPERSRFCCSFAMHMVSVSLSPTHSPCLSLLSPSCLGLIGKVLRSPAISCLALIMN